MIKLRLEKDVDTKIEYGDIIAVEELKAVPASADSPTVGVVISRKNKNNITAVFNEDDIISRINKKEEKKSLSQKIFDFIGI